jgi:hypothetical protein
MEHIFLILVCINTSGSTVMESALDRKSIFLKRGYQSMKFAHRA